MSRLEAFLEPFALPLLWLGGIGFCALAFGLTGGGAP